MQQNSAKCTWGDVWKMCYLHGAGLKLTGSALTTYRLETAGCCRRTGKGALNWK